MAKKKAATQLQRLCSSKGAITILQKNMGILLSKNIKDSDNFDRLLEMIVLVTKFQDKYLKRLTKIKEGLKTEDPKLFSKFGPFYATMKICGRDGHKTPKHHSFVSNQAGVKKLKIGKNIHYSPTSMNVHLSSEFNRFPLSLQHIKEFKSKESLGKLHDLMIEDILKETRNFITNNGRIINRPLF